MENRASFIASDRWKRRGEFRSNYNTKHMEWKIFGLLRVIQAQKIRQQWIAIAEYRRGNGPHRFEILG